jgi:arylsulfatase A-like enzyme
MEIVYGSFDWDLNPGEWHVASRLAASGYQTHLFGLQRAREAVYAEKTFHSYYDPMRCVRTERYKYIRSFETFSTLKRAGKG